MDCNFIKYVSYRKGEFVLILKSLQREPKLIVILGHNNVKNTESAWQILKNYIKFQLKGGYRIIFASNVFHNSHLIPKCIQNQQQLLNASHSIFGRRYRSTILFRDLLTLYKKCILTNNHRQIKEELISHSFSCKQLRERYNSNV